MRKFCAALLILSISALAASALPVDEKYASLTIYVKSADNGMPLAGAEVKIAIWWKHNCHSSHSKWQPLWRKESYFHTDQNGMIKLDRPEHYFTNGGYDGKATLSDHQAFMYAMTATSTGFVKAQQQIVLTYENPNPTATFYLPVYRGQ